MMLDKVCNSESLPVPGKGSPCCRCGPLLAKLNAVSTWEGSNVFVRRRQVRSTKFSIQFQRITITLSILHPPGEDLVSHADPNQLCTLATILPRTCPSASRSNAFGIASKVICSAAVGLIFPTCTSVITSVAIRPKSSCRRRKAGEARTPLKPIS